MGTIKSKVRGWIGEKATQAGIFLSLDSKTYKAFHDVIIRSGNGTTQIDHIIVSPYGIFVIETKNYSGWIFGSEKNAKWTQMMGRGKKKYSFQNPLRQNYKHTKSLSNYLGLSHEVMHSIVFFIGECKLKTKMPKNVMTSGVSRYIKSFERVILEPHEIDDSLIKIKEAFSDSSLTSKAHVKSLKQKHSTSKGKSLPSSNRKKERFVELKKTFCANPSCDYKGSLSRTKKGKFLIRLGALIMWIALIGGMIEIFNPDGNSVIVILFFLLIGMYGHRTAVKASKHLLCPQCDNPKSPLENVNKPRVLAPMIERTITNIRTNLYVLVDNQTQGPYTENQILEMMESGHINDDTQVCPEGSDQWISFKAYSDYM